MRLKGRESLAYGAEVRFRTGQLFPGVSRLRDSLMFAPTDMDPAASSFRMKIIKYYTLQIHAPYLLLQHIMSVFETKKVVQAAMQYFLHCHRASKSIMNQRKLDEIL